MRLSIRLDEELAKKAQASAGGIPMAAWVRLLIETEIGDTSPDPTAERFKRMEARLQAVEDEVFRMLKENSPPVEYPIEPIPDMARTILRLRLRSSESSLKTYHPYLEKTND